MMMQSMRNAFTVDLEEWFQGLTSTNPRVDLWPALESRVEQATDLLLRILDEHRVKATFFVLGHVADHHPALVERILVPEGVAVLDDVFNERFPGVAAATARYLLDEYAIDYGILHTCTLDSMGHRFGHDCVEMDNACLKMDSMLAAWLPR